LTVSSDDRVLGAALGLSILLHAAMLSVHSGSRSLHWKAASQPLEVVLVNAKTREKPPRPISSLRRTSTAAATSMSGAAQRPSAGDRAATPWDTLADAQRRVQQLEVQQQRLLAQAQDRPAACPSKTPVPSAPTSRPRTRGRDLADLSLAAMRLQAQIDKQIEQYQKRPRKKFIVRAPPNTGSRSTRRLA